ncbi:MAG: O-antigen ligase family protein [bacterium]|nr:O-antigen ligase family protein [bacterium]
MSFWQKVIATGFGLLFLLVPLVFLSNTSELFEFNKMIATYLFAIGIGFAWLARMISEKRWIFRSTLLDKPLLIFLGVILVSFVFSIDMHISWYGYYSRWNGGLLSLVTYAFLYWAYVSNLDRRSVLTTLTCALIGAAIVAIYGSLEHFGFSPSCLLTQGNLGVDCWVQDVKNRVFATIGQPNWLAAYLVTLIWLPLAYIGQASKKFAAKQLWLWGLFGLLVATLLFTKSRSGLLALAVSGTVYWGLSFFQAKPFKNYLGVGICGLVVFILATVVPNPVRDLVFKSSAPVPVGPALETGGTESGSIRKIVWTGALRIWQASPKNFLLGTGPETFAIAYYQFRPLEHNQTSEWELLYNKAHNEFLNYLSTTGALGLGAYLFLLIMMGRLLWPTKSEPLKMALFAGWVSLPITNFWGFSVVINQLLLFLLPAVGVCLAIDPQKEIKAGSVAGSQKISLILAGVLGLWLVWLTGRYWWADMLYARGLTAIKSFQMTLKPNYLISAYQSYSQAYALNKSEPTISSELAVSAGYLASSLARSDASSAAQLAQIAVAASDKALATSPHHPNYYKSRTRTMILLSDLDPGYLKVAAEALAKAAEISPTDPRIPYNLGVIYDYLQATPSAIEEFKKSLNLKPDYADPQVELDKIQK